MRSRTNEHSGVYYPAPLPREEQLELVRRAQAGDTAARNRLVTHTMRAVLRAAASARRRYAQELDIADLTQAGALGLMHAIDKFDLTRGVMFLTYAGHWINETVKQEAFKLRELRRADLSHGVSVYKSYVEATRTGKTHDEAIVEASRYRNMSVETAALYVASRTRKPKMSLDDTLGREGYYTLHETIAASAPSADEICAQKQREERVNRVFDAFRNTLSERERVIFDRRILAHEEDMNTLKEIGDSFGLSRERIRQVEARLKRRVEMRVRSELSGQL